MKLRCTMKTALLISGIVWAGCAGGEPDQRDVQTPAPAPAPPAQPDGDWVPDQGVHLLGAKADRFTETLTASAYLSVSTTAYSPSTVTLSLLPASQGAHLQAVDSATATTYSRNSSLFEGMILRASNGGQIRINRSAEITPLDLKFTGVADSMLASTEYFIQYLAPGAGPNDWQDFCDDPERGALPVLGRYTKNRAHIGSTTSISFVCNWGISYKCTMWGFGAGNSPGDDRWKLHNACEGGGNARYCGDAQSFTRELTPVWFVDKSTDPTVGLNQDDAPGPPVHPNPWPGDPDTFYIESAWLADGTPFCVSKVRWVSLPPTPCQGVLDDPRFIALSDHARFCDDFGVNELFNDHHVQVIVESKVMDIPLGRWATSKASNAEHISTISGVWIDAGGGTTDTKHTVPPPYPGTGGTPKYTIFEGNDGMVLRNLPGTLTPDKMTPLSMQIELNDDHHLVVGTDSSDPNFEGYGMPTPQVQDTEGEFFSGQQLDQCSWLGGDRDTHYGTAPLSGCAPGPILGFAFEAPVVPVPR